MSRTIGFAYGHAKGYCKRCKEIFGIGYNELNPLGRSDRCPKCNKWDKVETDDWIDQHISHNRMMLGWSELTTEQKERIKERILELERIKNIFINSNEEKGLTLQ